MMTTHLLLAGTESALAGPGPAVDTLNTVNCRLYTCAGAPGMNIFSYLLPGMNIFINFDE